MVLKKGGLAEIQQESWAPGLVQSTAFAENSILRDHQLWKLPHKFAEAARPQ